MLRSNTGGSMNHVHLKPSPLVNSPVCQEREYRALPRCLSAQHTAQTIRSSQSGAIINPVKVCDMSIAVLWVSLGDLFWDRCTDYPRFNCSTADVSWSCRLRPSWGAHERSWCTQQRSRSTLVMVSAGRVARDKFTPRYVPCAGSSRASPMLVVA